MRFVGNALRLVLLDRDGTLNRKAPEGNYVTDPSALELLPGAATAVRRLNDAGIATAVVTNQRALALGRCTAADVEAVHAVLAARLRAESGAHVDAIYYCSHAVDECRCRKPEPGLLEFAARDLGVSLRDAVMIGDAPSDVAAGRRVGALTVQILATGESSEADLTAPDLAAAIDLLLGR